MNSTLAASGGFLHVSLAVWRCGGMQVKGYPGDYFRFAGRRLRVFGDSSTFISHFYSFYVCLRKRAKRWMQVEDYPGGLLSLCG